MDEQTFNTFTQQVRAGNDEVFNSFLIAEYGKCKKALYSLITVEEERHDVILDAIYAFKKDYIERQRELATGSSFNISGWPWPKILKVKKQDLGETM